MTTDRQKRIERSHLDLVISSFPEFLPADHRIFEGVPARREPDFIVHLPDGTRIGIEHTRLEHPMSIYGHRAAELHSVPMQLARQTQAEFQRRDGRPFMVNAGVGPGPYRDVRAAARFFAERIGESADPRTTVNRSVRFVQDTTLDCHFAVWSEDAARDWTFFSVGTTLLLDKATVLAAIQRKSSVVALEGYRRSCDFLRLLCVSTMFPAWSDFVCPDDASQWSFSHGFDDVYVYCQQSSRLLVF